MKAWELADYDAALWYAELRFERACWACHRTRAERPERWNAPWLMHRAHIVSSPRREDRRAVIMLCPVCHTRSHGELLAGFEDVPQLSTGHMLSIKREADRAWYDAEFLGRCCVGRLPEPERLPRWFLDERRKRIG